MSSETVYASIINTQSSLTVNQFYGGNPPATPGNVGVCLSGGGSRALTAGMGQLRALSYLQLNGSSLLSQVKAISTVSGGSWLGVPYVFLPASASSDAAYLGTYVVDQGDITVTQLSQLPAGNAGVPLDSVMFSPEMLALEAYILYETLNVPTHMLWQTVIALNILSAYNLSAPGAGFAPTDFFTFNQSTQSEIIQQNAAIKSDAQYLYADAVSNSRTHRPYLICNMGMFLAPNTQEIALLVPVQATSFFTGVVGSPSGKDVNGYTPGGGGVQSFAFNSIFQSVNNGVATVSQTRQWSITDIVGTSSAFYAEKLENQFAEWEQNPAEFFELMLEFGKEILQWIENHLPLEAQAKAAALVTKISSATEDTVPLPASFSALTDLNPEYFYWPAANPTVVSNPQAVLFSDGGTIENTGIGGMLAYSDIDNILAFVNTEIPLAAGEYGISNGSGGYIQGTNVIVDESIPPLFGYQPYYYGVEGDPYTGYVTYSGNSKTNYPNYANNQVFDSTQFVTFLQQLWAASGNGSNSEPAVLLMNGLAIQNNSWFGVKGGRNVNVMFFYLNPAQSWLNLFSQNPTVQALIQQYVTNYTFPNYSTFDTDLDATQINLLANFTSWTVVSNFANITPMFSGAGAAVSGK